MIQLIVTQDRLIYVLKSIFMFYIMQNYFMLFEAVRGINV